MEIPKIGLLFDPRERTQWLENRVTKALEKDHVSTSQAEILLNQARERRMQGYILDLAVAFPVIEVASLAIYPLLYHLTDGNLGAVVAAFASPITPAGLPRLLYTAARASYESIYEGNLAPFKSRVWGFVSAPIKGLGSFSLPIQVATHYPEMGRFLIEETIRSSTTNIGRLGSPGRFLANKASQAGIDMVAKRFGPK